MVGYIQHLKPGISVQNNPLFIINGENTAKKFYENAKNEVKES